MNEIRKRRQPLKVPQLLRRAVVFLLLSCALPAQSVWGQAVGPAFFEGRQQPKAAPAPPPSLGLSLPAPAAAVLPPLGPKDLERLKPQAGLTPVGVHRSLPEGAVALSVSGGAAKTTVEGAWQATVAGRLWRLRVTSPGARVLRIHFQDFDVGTGSVWLHGADGQIDGPYGGRGGMYGDGDFWSDIVFGDSATIEYLPDPAAVLTAEAAPFRIAAVSHIWSVPGFTGDGSPPSPSSHPSPAPCHLDATCYSDWSDSSKGVALILFERDGNTFGCSGALLIDRPSTFIPYFLTAAHCINTDAQARSAIMHWRYQTQTCNGIPPSLYSVPTTRGARLLTTMDGGVCTNEEGEEGICTDRGGDAALLRLAEDPPGGTWYLGWDPTSQPVGASVTGIHHPASSFKRISFGSTAWQEYSYHIVSWSQGRTEPGSSGSPLFEGFDGSGIVTGVASFGRREDEHEDICLTNPVTGYMKFSDFYPRIQQFLEGEDENPPPTVILRASPASIARGGSAILQWSSTNAASARIDQGIGAVATSGSRRVSPTATTTYTITVTSADGQTATDSVRVAVTAPPTIAGGRLTPGQPARFRLGPVDRARLFNGQHSYRLEVPADASRVTFTLDSVNPNVNVDIWGRYGQDITAPDGYDYASTSSSSNEEIVITRSSNPPLQAGTYYVSLGLWDTDVVAQGTLTATVETAAEEPRAGGPLTPGQPASFRLGPVDNPTIFTGGYSYRLEVPDNASRATLILNSNDPGVDVDIYVRFGQDNDVQNGQVATDYSSTGLFGNEQIVINRFSGPPLRAGIYFVSLALIDTGIIAEGALTATLQIDELPPGPRISSGGIVLATGTPVVNRISPNSLISVFGQDFAPEGTQALSPVLDAAGRVAANLADTCLEIDGRRAPLFAVFPHQINAQTPHDLTPRQSQVAAIRGCGTEDERRGAAATVAVAAVSPAFFNFPVDPDGRNPIVALHGGGPTLVGPPGLIPGVTFTPAEPGEVITLFGTGFGETELQLEVGQIPSGAAALASDVSFTFGGIAVPSWDVLYAGVAPCCAGLYQFTARLPPIVPDGNAPVTATVQGVTTPEGPFLTVRRRQ